MNYLWVYVSICVIGNIIYEDGLRAVLFFELEETVNYSALKT